MYLHLVFEVLSYAFAHGNVVEGSSEYQWSSDIRNLANISALLRSRTQGRMP